MVFFRLKCMDMKPKKNLFLRIIFTLICVFILLGSTFFSLRYFKSPETQSRNTLDTIHIGRLICGGHLPLAIVEKKFQDQLKTFQLHTVQNHDWVDVVTDMKSGKLAGTFILSPLAMNLIHEGFPEKLY